MIQPPFAELHCHSNFSFLDGASPVEDLVERAVELGLTGLAITDHQGLYGVVRFAAAAQEAGLRPVIGVEIELLDAAAPDPRGTVVPARREGRRGRGGGAESAEAPPAPVGGAPAGPSGGREGGPPRDRRAAARAAPRPARPRRRGLPEPLPARLCE